MCLVNQAGKSVIASKKNEGKQLSSARYLRLWIFWRLKVRTTFMVDKHMLKKKGTTFLWVKAGEVPSLSLGATLRTDRSIASDTNKNEIKTINMQCRSSHNAKLSTRSLKNSNCKTTGRTWHDQLDYSASKTKARVDNQELSHLGIYTAPIHCRAGWNTRSNGKGSRESMQRIETNKIDFIGREADRIQQ